VGIILPRISGSWIKNLVSGGEIKVNKNTWYAHWHKTIGRGYSLDREQEKAEDRLLLKNGWVRAGINSKLPLAWL
jgi:lipopolysaccharide assembly outer membrane protein LptD (OstA)